jgi:hypothetical protein
MLVPLRGKAQDKSSDYSEYCAETLKDESRQIGAYVGLCYGFLDGWEEAATTFSAIWGADETLLSMPYCVPNGVTYRQRARIWLNYLEAHPEQLHLTAGTTYYRSLLAAFPCQ